MSNNESADSSTSDSALIADLSGLGKPLNTLIEYVSKAFGKLYLPKSIREEGRARADADTYMADAEAYRIERLAEAELKKKRILESEKDGLFERAGVRVVQRETSRQYNIEQTVSTAIAMAELDGQAVSTESLSIDWIQRYLDYVENVSDPDIQMIWARILARKATNQKRSVSLMTLDSLRLLEFNHAATFDVLARCCITFGSIIITSSNFSSIKMGLDELAALESLGFVKRRIYTENAIPLRLGLTLVTYDKDEFTDKHKQIDHYVKYDEGIEQYKLSFRGVELADVIVKNADRAKEILRSEPSYFLDAETQSRILAEWAIHYASKGNCPRIISVLGSYDEISSRKKSLGKFTTHEWNNDLKGWKRLPDADKFETPDIIYHFEIK